VYRSDAVVPQPDPGRVIPMGAVRPWTATSSSGRRAEAPAAAAPSSRGWFETGLYVMTLPVAITAAMMFAPLAWMLASRRR
jgi:hypothetical protein